jgi:hypothetical protein
MLLHGNPVPFGASGFVTDLYRLVWDQSCPPKWSSFDARTRGLTERPARLAHRISPPGTYTRPVLPFPRRSVNSLRDERWSRASSRERHCPAVIQISTFLVESCVILAPRACSPNERPRAGTKGRINVEPAASGPALRADYRGVVARFGYRGWGSVVGCSPIVVPITSPDTTNSTRRFC